MSCEWDENKRRLNLQRRGLDFADAEYVMKGEHILSLGYPGPSGEIREVATGMLDDICVTVVFTRRNGAIRVISFRRASKNERSAFQQILDG